jgi:hypothetical protein
MVEVYFYLPVEDVENAVECGLKLSRWYDKEVSINGETRKCISALLNPKDDLVKYKCQAYRCVKLELSPNYCFVADRYLYTIGLDSQKVMKAYTDSIIPIEKYNFGMYRLPECLVTSTPISGQISLLGKGLDSPVIFDNSEELYLSNIIESCRERYEEFNDTLLYYFCCKLAEIQKVDKIEVDDKKTAVFIDNRDNRVIVTRIPDIEQY